MKENKNVVMRVTEREERILNYIRRKGDNLIGELKSARYKLGGYEILGDMVALIEDKQLMSLSKLIEIEFIGKEEAEMLVEAMDSNKNILIVGATSVGKTTLLNALIEYQKDVVMKIVGRRHEVYVPERLKDNEELNTRIIQEIKENVDMGDIASLIGVEGYKHRRMVISELIGLEGVLALASVVGAGVSVLTTAQRMHLDNIDGVNKHIKDILEDHKFTIVEAGIDKYRNRKIINITEN